MKIDNTQARKANELAIIKANIPKTAENRDGLIEATQAFINQFVKVTPTQVKELTLLRQANGNEDLTLVPLIKVPTAEQLAEAMETHYTTEDYLVLKKGETVPTSPSLEM